MNSVFTCDFIKYIIPRTVKYLKGKDSNAPSEIHNYDVYVSIPGMRGCACVETINASNGWTNIADLNMEAEVDLCSHL